jgi:hypothetical protein
MWRDKWVVTQRVLVPYSVYEFFRPRFFSDEAKDIIILCPARHTIYYISTLIAKNKNVIDALEN